MTDINIVVIGAGLYVCGRGTTGYGTVLPAIFEWKRERDPHFPASVHCVSTSVDSAQELAEKASQLVTKTGVDFELEVHPKLGVSDALAYRKVIASIPKPACAIIAVPDHLHYRVAKDCLDAGLHTLLVKPLTPTVVEGESLVKLAEAKKLYGAVEFHKRWDTSNLLLRDKIRSGDVGLPINCWVEYSQRRSIPLQSFKQWASKTSILQYLGVHYIDVIRFATSATPLRVMAIGQKTEIVQHGIDTYDAIQCVIEWADPSGHRFTETILTSWLDPASSTALSDQKIKFVGTLGRYEADQKERGIRVNTMHNGVEHLNPDFCMPFGVEDGKVQWRGYGIESINTFLEDVVGLESHERSLEQLQHDRPSFRESLISTKVIEAAHRSLERNSEWQSIDA